MNPKWPEVKLGEVLVERQEEPDPRALEIGQVRVVGKISFSSGKLEFRQDGKTKTGMITIQPGDLVVSGINATKGAIAIYDPSEEAPAAATIHYGTYSVREDRADRRFLWWLLRSNTFREILKNHVPGGIKTELKAKRLLLVPIPLPPLAEQRRIVAKIEQVIANIHEVQTLRQKAIVEAEAIHSSAIATLTHALQGKIEKLGEIVDSDALRNGKSVKSCGDSCSIFCLTLSSLRLGRINLSDKKPVPLTQDEANPFIVHRGDVFVVRGNGSKALCGQAGFVDHDASNVIFPDLFIRIPLTGTRLLPEFFVAVWNSGPVRASIEDKAKTTSGIWKINQGHIASTLVPVPSLAEQQRIVTKLDALQVWVDRLKTLQIQTAAEFDALLPSVLDAAFQGRLVASEGHQQALAIAPSAGAEIACVPTKGRPCESAAAMPEGGARGTTDRHVAVLCRVLHFHRGTRHEKTLGSVKAEKISHLVEAHAEVDLGRSPVADVAGPVDYPHLNRVVHRATRLFAFSWKLRKSTDGHEFFALGGFEKRRDLSTQALGDKMAEVDRIIKLLLPMDTERAEIVATLYACWNDFLAKGTVPDDAQIIEDFYAWDKSKRCIKQWRLETALKWMRDHSLVPTGRGKISTRRAYSAPPAPQKHRRKA